MVGAQPTVDDVERSLRRYADRGVFRSFSTAGARGGKRKFSFAYVSARRIELVFDPRTGSLTFPRLLPNAPADSRIYRDLKAFIRSRTLPEVPDHRRIHPARATVKCSNRKGYVTLKVVPTDGDVAYACRSAVKLIGEVFLGFLSGPYAEYMVANFDRPEE